MLRYYKLFDLMNKKGIKKNDLRQIISPNTVAKLSKGDYVSGEIIDKLCIFLKCQPSDIMEVYKVVEFVDENGEIKTKEVLANQETVDFMNQAISNPELWKMYEQLGISKDVLQQAKGLFGID